MGLREGENRSCIGTDTPHTLHARDQHKNNKRFERCGVVGFLLLELAAAPELEVVLVLGIGSFSFLLP